MTGGGGHVFLPDLTDHKGWPMVRFQPILAAALWVATWHVVMLPGPGFGLTETFGRNWFAQEAWLAVSLVCPPLLLLSWWMVVRLSGTWRYRGLWIRLGADAGQSLVLAAFLWSRLSTSEVDEGRIYGWIVLSGCLLFLLCCVWRDLYVLAVTERVAAHARKVSADELTH